MVFRRTDVEKIHYPKGISSEDRRFCRDIYNQLNKRKYIPLGIACSGGLDSTALAHAYSRAFIISGFSLKTALIYANHMIRPENEIEKDISHIQKLADDLGFRFHVVDASIEKARYEKNNVQSMARQSRYSSIGSYCRSNGYLEVALAHNANDVAETKLWQFLTGRPTKGISKSIVFNGTLFFRPLLSFTRKDLERYCSIWNLSWQEDSSNSTKKYARNRIRHELIPWVEGNVNPGIVKILAHD